jgi:hypothetical protein
MQRLLRSGALALSVLAVAAASAGAQGTPTPTGSIAVDPALCTTAPISTDHAAALLATPVPTPVPPLTDHGIVALPSGSPADEATVAAVGEVLSQFWACNNARNKAAVFGLFTDQAFQETVGFTGGAAWDAADLRAEVAAALTPGEPRPPAEWATIDTLVSVTTYPDGRVGVLALNTDPLVAAGDQVLDYFQFAPVADGSYNISQVILDPYDLTAGYGFEKAA